MAVILTQIHDNGWRGDAISALDEQSVAVSQSRLSEEVRKTRHSTETQLEFYIRHPGHMKELYCAIRFAH